MQETKHEHTTPTRRLALRFGATAALAGLVMPAVAKADSGSDTELLALCDRALLAEEHIRFIDRHGVSEEECSAALNLWDVLFTKLAGMPATTPAGIQAKANVVRVAVFREAIHAYSGYRTTDDVDVSDLPIDIQLAVSLCRDVLAGSAVA